MKTALILGITGNFGSQMAKALANVGWNVRALVREEAKAPTWLSSDDIWVGDVHNGALIERAALGVELIVYAINPAYHRWESEAMDLMEPTVRVAEKLKSRILFPGNVYNFAPLNRPISEDSPMEAVSEKGAIRIRMEHRLHQASQQGANITIVRAGDFIGPDTHFTWLDVILKQTSSHAKMRLPHDESHVHFWSFLPDLCANTALLMSKPQSSYEIWHDEGLKLGLNDWKKAFLENGKNLNVGKFPWWVFKLISPLTPLVREVVKMQYLWQQPVLLDGNKMKQALQSQYQATSLANILPLLVKK
ncbi:NAD-dependent epimerase/dehydratase family protein [Vibrio algarum]|uniref:NAD-dependent epimerase/dehydratase family protein n=1 Tax=Vibrio algarum TaxID=3020714 RepID=A0ABT4YUA4_9VIBR|nr:NAD-dependent epimerase/dehydratase family protein [Vibrio sp. KJ40-1]MDB1125118.1 NAD-dependent epimerase/dehydratase family protein [Vibrio sp. KJ40-1]